jgi:hypothetical protein
VVRGLENFAAITKGALNRPSTVKGVSAADIADMGGRTLAGSAMRMVGVAPLKPLATRLEGSVLGKTFETFDELLTSPEGARTLEKLGRVPAISPAAQAILATWGAQRATNSDGSTRP